MNQIKEIPKDTLSFIFSPEFITLKPDRFLELNIETNKLIDTNKNRIVKKLKKGLRYNLYLLKIFCCSIIAINNVDGNDFKQDQINDINEYMEHFKRDND